MELSKNMILTDLFPEYWFGHKKVLKRYVKI